ncbi:MAG: hypothetical protein ABI416_14565 [Ginsengibacter sp.]
MFRNFVAILLEPLSYALFSIAFLLRISIEKQAKVKVLFIYYLVAAVGFGYASWLVFRNQNNTWIYNLLYLPAVVSICFYFHETFYKGSGKAIVKFFIALNVIYFIIRITLFGKMVIIDSFGYSLLSISVSFLSFVYFYQLLRHVNELKVWANFDFWLISSYLLYFLGSFFIFLLYANLTYDILHSYTYEQRSLLSVLWGVHNVLLFLSSLITLVGSLWVAYHNR